MRASPTGGGVRVLRATVLGLVTLALAAAAHVLGGGEPPGGIGLALAVGPLALGAGLVTRRRLSLVAVLGWLAPAEALLHVYFGTAASSAAGPAMAGHVHGGSGAGLPLAGLSGIDPLTLSSGTTAMSQMSQTMLVAHAVATVLTGLALSHGEHLLWLLWESLCPALIGDAVAPPIGPATVPTAPPSRPRRSSVLRSPHPRGPPSTRHAVA